MRKNPDGSIPFNYVVNKKGMMSKIQGLVNKQNFYLASPGENSNKQLYKIRKEILELYRKLIIGTSIESTVIYDANSRYYNMCRSKNRREVNIDDDKSSVDMEKYNKLASSEFGKSDNIVRCELNREEEFEEVEIQKLALWSNKLAHSVENDSVRYMTDLGYGYTSWYKKQITPEQKEKNKIREKRFIANLRKSYRRYTEEDKYKFAIDKAYNQISQEDFDINTKDQNIINLRKLMNASGFSRSSNDKNAMRSFLTCLRNQRNKDYLFRLKENFTKELMIKINKLKEDSTLGAYYVDDYAVKDNKGRDTIRVVFHNKGEANRYIENNDYMYITKAWKESLKIENAAQIVREVKEDATTKDYEDKLDEIIDKKVKGKHMTRSELDSLCVLLSASVYHVPKYEFLNYFRKNGIEIDKAKNVTQKSIAYAGNESVDVGFGSESNDKPFQELDRYIAASEEVGNIAARNTALTSRKQESITNKGE